MKRTLSSFAVLAILLILAWSCQQAPEQKEVLNTWGDKQVVEHAQSYQDPTLWDTAALNMEARIAHLLLEYDTPLNLTPFPTPKYESPGNGNEILEFSLDSISLVGHTASLGRGPHCEYLFEGIEGDRITYFTILTINEGKNEEDHPVIASSRNHPHYIAQGSLNANKNTRVDWVAFQTTDSNAYALVNGRLFDLRAGRLILAKVKEDKTIRFLQVDRSIIETDSLKTMVDQELQLISNRGFFLK